MEKALLSMASEFTGLPMNALIGGPLNAAVKANCAMALMQTKFMLDNCFTLVQVPATPAVTGQPAVIDAATGVVTTPETFTTPAIPAHNSYLPIMVTMSLTRSVITDAQKAIPANTATGTTAVAAVPTTIQNMTTAFSIPLLTIIPINSLAVQTVNINFEMEVKSSFAEDTSEKKEKEMKAEVSFEAKASFGPFSVDIKGSASYDQKDSSTHDTHYQKSNSAKYTVGVTAGQLPMPPGVQIIIQAFANSISPIEVKAS